MKKDNGFRMKPRTPPGRRLRAVTVWQEPKGNIFTEYAGRTVRTKVGRLHGELVRITAKEKFSRMSRDAVVQRESYKTNRGH
ncbi:hypothetical protein CS369_03160 [Candidatus Symbiopectobacterium sp. 'North America']|nr:hypothetical protein [Candidatus Symbiopectobacterium sp. 'North America']